MQARVAGREAGRGATRVENHRQEDTAMTSRKRGGLGVRIASSASCAPREDIRRGRWVLLPEAALSDPHSDGLRPSADEAWRGCSCCLSFSALAAHCSSTPPTPFRARPSPTAHRKLPGHLHINPLSPQTVLCSPDLLPPGQALTTPSTLQPPSLLPWGLTWTKPYPSKSLLMD